MYDIFNQFKNRLVNRDYSGKTIFKYFLIALIIVTGFAQLTEFDNLKPVATDLTSKLFVENQGKGGVNQLIVGNTGQQLLGSINQQCKSQDTMLLPIPLGYQTMKIDCKKIREGGDSGLAQYISDNIMKDYYKHYDCSPIGCMVNMLVYKRPEEASYSFSGEMNSFLKKIVPFLLVGTLIGLAMIIYSSRKIIPITKEVGGVMLGIAGIPFLILLLIIYRESIFISTGIFSGKEEFMMAINNFFSGPTYLIVTIFATLLAAPFFAGAVLTAGNYINEKRLKSVQG